VAELLLTAVGSTVPGRYGADPPQLALGEVTLYGAWNAQGDPARASFADAVMRAFGIALPVASNTTARAAGSTAFWLGPASWLIVARTQTPAIDFDAARHALNAADGALVDVSSSRVAFSLAGEHASTVLAKACPLDFHPGVFLDGGCAQSLFSQVGTLFYRRGRTEWLLMVPRSYARDVWRLLCISAMEYGYEVPAPTPFG
jgi:heterotetrameric sarcosine oxidase gamma subunit